MKEKYAIFEIKGGILQVVDTIFYFDTIEEAKEYLTNHCKWYDFEYKWYTILPIYYVDVKV